MVRLLTSEGVHMCLICVQYELGKLTAREALQNLLELKDETEEHKEVAKVVIQTDEAFKQLIKGIP